jgi:hypothetical protein
MSLQRPKPCDAGNPPFHALKEVVSRPLIDSLMGIGCNTMAGGAYTDVEDSSPLWKAIFVLAFLTW